MDGYRIYPHNNMFNYNYNNKIPAMIGDLYFAHIRNENYEIANQLSSMCNESCQKLILDSLTEYAISLALAKNLTPSHLQFLIRMKMDINLPVKYGPLLFFSMYDIELVKMLIDNGADVNLSHVLEGEKLTALKIATAFNSPEITDLLVEHGAKA